MNCVSYCLVEVPFESCHSETGAGLSKVVFTSDIRNESYWGANGND